MRVGVQMLEAAMKERDESFSKIAKENNILFAENEKLQRRLEKTLSVLKR